MRLQFSSVRKNGDDIFWGLMLMLVPLLFCFFSSFYFQMNKKEVLTRVPAEKTTVEEGR